MLKGIGTVLLSVLLVLVILLVGVKFIGLTPYTVLSGSMEPTYHVGSIIYVKDAVPTALEVGDPLTFKVSGNVVVTHRIVEIVPSQDGSTTVSFRVKGDANDSVDAGLVQANQIIGQPIFTLPYLGYVAHFAQTAQGRYLIIVACLLCILGSLLFSLLTKKKKTT